MSGRWQIQGALPSMIVRARFCRWIVRFVITTKNSITVWVNLNQGGDVKLLYTNIHSQRWSSTDPVMTHVEPESLSLPRALIGSMVEFVT